MVDFKIDSRPKDPFEKVKVEDVIRKKEKEEKGSSPIITNEPRLKFLAVFYLILKRFFDAFSSKEKKRTISFQEVIKDVHIFYSLLKKLTQEDLSKESTFLNELSFFWIKLNHDILHCEPLGEEQTFSDVQSFIESINRYPEGQGEFTLGYYLSSYAGFKWIPFPFLGMIQKLYEEYRKDAKTSQLQAWTNTLATILGSNG
jgi:hypothetical protein